MKHEHVLSVLRQSRGGRYNDARFGKRMRGVGVFADMLSQRFKLARQRLGLDTSLFRPPRIDGQLDLFS